MLGSFTAAPRWLSLLLLTWGFWDQGVGEAESWQEPWQLCQEANEGRKLDLVIGLLFTFFFLTGNGDYGWEKKTQKQAVPRDPGLSCPNFRGQRWPVQHILSCLAWHICLTVR